MQKNIILHYNAHVDTSGSPLILADRLGLSLGCSSCSCLLDTHQVLLTVESSPSLVVDFENLLMYQLSRSSYFLGFTGSHSIEGRLLPLTLLAGIEKNQTSNNL